MQKTELHRKRLLGETGESHLTIGKTVYQKITQQNSMGENLLHVLSRK